MTKPNKTKVDMLPETKMKFNELKGEIIKRECLKVPDYEIMRRIFQSDKVHKMAIGDAEKRRKLKYGY